MSICQWPSFPAVGVTTDGGLSAVSQRFCFKFLVPPILEVIRKDRYILMEILSSTEVFGRAAYEP